MKSCQSHLCTVFPAWPCCFLPIGTPVVPCLGPFLWLPDMSSRDSEHWIIFQEYILHLFLGSKKSLLPFQRLWNSVHILKRHIQGLRTAFEFFFTYPGTGPTGFLVLSLNCHIFLHLFLLMYPSIHFLLLIFKLALPQ